MSPPDVSTASRKAAVSVEDTIRWDALETGVLIAPNGNILARHQGLADQVGLTKAELAMGRDATFTHNHPGGLGPSLQDVVIAAQFGFRELRVVTRSHRHVVRKLSSGLIIPLDAAFATEEQLALRSAKDDLKKGLLAPADVRPITRHRTWLRLANRLSFDYWQEQS